MNVTVAIDSFKGSLSTFESGNAVADGIKRVYPSAKVTVCPLADGGEGTVEAVVSSEGGTMVRTEVCGPLGKSVIASYGIAGDTAIVEMSSAAGITLIAQEERNPLLTTTYGVGEIIREAIVAGCRNFIIGIGGSATNDGGVGMLQALGFGFYDKAGNPIARGAGGLETLAKIDVSGALPQLGECSFRVACDVTNPLCGPLGCSAIFGPQKGADESMIKDMDLWLANYARLTGDVISDSDADAPGAGAAGGMGFALMSYLGAKLQPGIELVIEATGLEENIASADIVITGEGRLDGQSCMGKAPVGVAKLAKSHGKKVIALAGCVTDDAKECNLHGIDAFFPILKGPCSLDEAMDVSKASANIADAAEQVFRIVKAFSAE